MTKLSGGLNNYYVVQVKNPQRKEQEPYQAECEDIIQALGMTFDEGCAFKALWRNAAARMGNGKPGNEAVYEAEKLVHYANRILAKEQVAKIVAPFQEDPYGWKNADEVKIESGLWVETISYSGAKHIAEMQDVPWQRVSMFRYLEEQPLRADSSLQGDSTGCGTASSCTKIDDGWVYSSIKPTITQKYKSIDVVYRKGWRGEFAFVTNITWENVWKYRINYS